MDITFFIYLILITIFFLIYVELSVGNIIYRINSLGTYSINFMNVIKFLLEPLYNSYLWNISLLDINYIFIITISIFIYYKYIL